MKGLFVISTAPYSGKTGFILVLGQKLKELGLKMGYFKPYGWWLRQTKEGLVDEDALYVAETLGITEPLELASPVFLSAEWREKWLEGQAENLVEKVKKSYAEVGQGKDIVLVEGGISFYEGKFGQIDAPNLAHVLGLKTLLIIKGSPVLALDTILAAAELFQSNLVGVIFNRVPTAEVEKAKLTEASLARQAVEILGVIPEERTLMGITVAELTQSLNGEILCCEEKENELLDTFMVGAMGQEKALGYFRLKEEKVVITGGDRADIQLAALETPTKCLILTGNLYPSSYVLSRASDLGVPVVLVPHDTFTVVDKTEQLLGKVRVHEPEKVKLLRELFDQHFDWDIFFEKVGLAK